VCTGQASSCRCPSGFEGHPTLGCVDVDECARGMTCGANEQCRNESPGASCQCLNGFVRVGGQCVINRCLSGNGGCHASATCSMRTPTDVACTCHQGFIGDGQRCAAECLSSGACADPSLTCYPSADSWYGVCERPGFGPAGSLCATNGDCQTGTRCEHAPGGNIGFCAQLCTNTSCSAGETCTQRNDGVWAMETEGAARGASKLFFKCPFGAELCGPEFTPDGETFFVAIQHPGETDPEDPSAAPATYENPSTRWPDFRPDMPPRPSIVAITRRGGGKIGT